MRQQRVLIVSMIALASVLWIAYGSLAQEQKEQSQEQPESQPPEQSQAHNQSKTQTPKLSPAEIAKIRKQRAEEQHQAIEKENKERERIFNKRVDIVNHGKHGGKIGNTRSWTIIPVGPYCVFRAAAGYLKVHSWMQISSSSPRKNRVNAKAIAFVSQPGEATQMTLVHNENGTWTIVDRTSGGCLESMPDLHANRLNPRQPGNKNQEWLIKPSE